MFRFGKSRVHILAVMAFTLELVLLAGCQQGAAPQPTPKAGETPAQKLAAVATTTKPAAKPVRGGTLHVWLGTDRASLDPQVAALLDPAFALYEPLIQPDKDGNPTKEGLVRDWTVSGDGKAITFKLREGVKFQDGTDFDATAVKFNIERMKDPAEKSLYRVYYDAVNSVETIDRATARFNLSQPNSILVGSMATQAGMVVSPAAAKKYGQDFPRNPVGTGPFQFVDWKPDASVTLKRFVGYWKKDQEGNQLPYLEGVEYQITKDTSVAVANLRTGQADLYSAFSGFPPQQLPILKSDPNLTYGVRTFTNVPGVNMNTKKPPFDNKALRQAVALAVDREGIAGLFGEGAQVHASLLNATSWAYDGKAGIFPARDLAKAKAKMAEAGHSGGGLKVKLSTGNSSDSVRTTEIVKANLAEIGIEAEIEVLDQVTHEGRMIANVHQIANGGLGIGIADPGFQFSQFIHSKGGRNWGGPYSNPKVDELLDKAASIYDQKERTALYWQIANILVEEAVYVPTHVVNIIAAMNKKVKNFVQYPDTGTRLSEVWLAQ